MTTCILPSDCIDDLADLAWSGLKQCWLWDKERLTWRFSFTVSWFVKLKKPQSTKGWCKEGVAVLLFYLIKLQCFYWISPTEKGPDVQSRHHWPGRHCGKTELTNKDTENQNRQISTCSQSVKKRTIVVYIYIYYFASLQLSSTSTYSTATINSSCGFAFNTHFRPGAVTAGAAYANTVSCGLCGGRKGYEIEIFIISETDKDFGECGGLSYG